MIDQSFMFRCRSSVKHLCHLNLKDHLIKRSLVMCGSSLCLIRMENQFSSFEQTNQIIQCFSITESNQFLARNFELFLNQRSLFYIKSRIIGLKCLRKYQSNQEIVKISPVVKPSGDHIKSSNYNIEQPLVVVGQWSPSSSEDG
jgi:hypothetical protein